MNTPTANRHMVSFDAATTTTGMKKLDLDVRFNRYISGGDKIASPWPCKKNHPHYRVGLTKSKTKPKRLYCRECQLEKKQQEREG